MTVLFVVGTGTEIGKTHTAEALLRAASGRGVACLGYKPVESGVAPGSEGEDTGRLKRASSFHVKHEPLAYRLRRPVSPHLAARDEGVVIAVESVASEIRTLSRMVDLTVVELAGGLFSPLNDTLLNAHLVRQFHDDPVILVAPDRLGVLHDIAATTRAATAMAIRFCGLILSAPQTPDASTGANGLEVHLVTSVPLVASLPRAPATALAARADLVAFLDSLAIPTK